MKVSALKIVAACAFLLLGSACPATGIVCMTGTVRCGEGCADPQQDSRNCGSCGNACATGQQCNAGQCACSPGSVSCSGSCAVLDSDPKNCGACGHACAASEVCEGSTCKQDCSVGTNIKCGGSCVSQLTDINNCGGCGQKCETGQNCTCGMCGYDFVAACFSTGQIVGFSETTLQRGTLHALGSGPASLAWTDNTVLSADGIDRQLNQAAGRAAVGTTLLSKLDAHNQVGAVANQVLVDGDFVYVVNAETGSVQTLKRQSGSFQFADGGTGTGISYSTIGELALGTNTYPQGAVKVGSALFVPLYGGYGHGPAAAGQRVVKLAIADGLLSIAGETDLHTLDLHAFDGGSPVARPWAIISHQNAVYVALNNLNADSYAPEGPGMLAKINPDTLAVSGIDLGAQRCLNPQWLQSDGTRLFISCGGKPTYDANFALISNDNAGVLMLSAADQFIANWEPKCATDAGLPDGGSSCAPFLPGRFALKNNVVYVGDQNQGRVAVLHADTSSLDEFMGPAAIAGRSALNICPLPQSGVSNVADILTVPACLTR